MLCICLSFIHKFIHKCQRSSTKARPGPVSYTIEYKQLYMCTMSLRSCSAWSKTNWFSFKTPLRNWDQLRLSESCWDRDFFESLSNHWYTPRTLTKIWFFRNLGLVFSNILKKLQKVKQCLLPKNGLANWLIFSHFIPSTNFHRKIYVPMGNKKSSSS